MTDKSEPKSKMPTSLEMKINLQLPPEEELAELAKSLGRFRKELIEGGGFSYADAVTLTERLLLHLLGETQR